MLSGKGHRSGFIVMNCAGGLQPGKRRVMAQFEISSQIKKGHPELAKDLA
jgi:hypothetical protein